MSSALFRLAPLDVAHDRTEFACGSEPLDGYLREQVTQDIRHRVAACFAKMYSQKPKNETKKWQTKKWKNGKNGVRH